jgi:hypothetical protein
MHNEKKNDPDKDNKGHDAALKGNLEYSQWHAMIEHHHVRRQLRVLQYMYQLTSGESADVAPAGLVHTQAGVAAVETHEFFNLLIEVVAGQRTDDANFRDPRIKCYKHNS